jgi:hypothetical protein
VLLRFKLYFSYGVANLPPVSPDSDRSLAIVEGLRAGVSDLSMSCRDARLALAGVEGFRNGVLDFSFAFEVAERILSDVESLRRPSLRGTGSRSSSSCSDR